MWLQWFTILVKGTLTTSGAEANAATRQADRNNQQNNVQKLHGTN